MLQVRKQHNVRNNLLKKWKRRFIKQLEKIDGMMLWLSIKKPLILWLVFMVTNYPQIMLNLSMHRLKRQELNQQIKELPLIHIGKMVQKNFGLHSLGLLNLGERILDVQLKMNLKCSMQWLQDGEKMLLMPKLMTV